MACYGHLWPDGKPTQISPPPQEMSAEVHGTNGWNFKLRNAKRTGGLHMPSPWIKLTWLKTIFGDVAAWQAGARGPLQLKVRCSVCRLPQSMWPPSCGKSFRACNLRHRPVGWWKDEGLEHVRTLGSENHQTKPTVQSSTSAKRAGPPGPMKQFSLCIEFYITSLFQWGWWVIQHQKEMLGVTAPGWLRPATSENAHSRPETQHTVTYTISVTFFRNLCVWDNGQRPTHRLP